MKSTRDSWCLLGLAFLCIGSVVAAQPLSPRPSGKIESRIESDAKKGGFTTGRDDKGRLAVKDNERALPSSLGMDKQPSKEEIEKREASIKKFAEENGFTTERDDRGRLVVKDNEGNILLPPPPPGQVERLEAAITAYARENNLELSHDELGRLVALDADGKPVPLVTIMGKQADAGNGEKVSYYTETESAATTIIEEAGNPDEAIDQTE